MKRTRSSARGFAAMTAVPFAAVVLAVHPGVAAADPKVIGEIASGSAASEIDTAQPIDDAPTGSSLGLGSGSDGSGSSSGVGGAASGSTSANGGASSGSSSEHGGATSGSALGLNPVAGGAYLSTGSAATSSAGTGSGGGEPAAAGIALPGIALPGIALPAAAGLAVPAASPASGTLGETLGLQPGSVLTACAGSAILGSAAIGSGLATGSGLGSGLLGPGFVPGSSGLVGPGSAGAGSVMLGSAVTGSALLTCLLLLPTPSVPGIPLLFPAAAPLVPVAAPIAPPEPPAAPVVPKVIPPHEIPAAAAPLPEPFDWNTLQMMTVMVLTILAAGRAKASRGRRG